MDTTAYPTPDRPEPDTFSQPEPTSGPRTMPSTTDARIGQPGRNRLRSGTVVLGVIVVFVGIFMVALTTGLPMDAELVVIAMLALGGVALLGGALGAVSRPRRQ